MWNKEGELPPVQRHAGRRAPALERAATASRRSCGRATSATAWSTTPRATCSSASTSPRRSCASGPTARARRSPPTTRARSSTAPTTSSRARTARSTSPTRASAGCPASASSASRSCRFQGVYRIAAGGGEPELVVAEDEFEQPNGLCFSPDESLMYINDTPRALIRVYDVQPDGTLSNGRLFFDGIGSGVIEEGIPDGMKCDERGNIWVTGPRRRVGDLARRPSISASSRCPRTSATSPGAAPDWKMLYMPSSTSLYRVPTKVASATLPYHYAHERRYVSERTAAPGPQALRADHPGPAERRDHRGRGVRRLRRAGARQEPERRRERRPSGRRRPRGRHAGDPRPLHRRGGRRRA